MTAIRYAPDRIITAYLSGMKAQENGEVRAVPAKFYTLKKEWLTGYDGNGSIFQLCVKARAEARKGGINGHA